MDIAYQVVGEGDLDIVLVPGWITHCELTWELAENARFRERLREFGRLVIYDKRGTGLSDRVARPPALEEHADDMRAVLDAVGSEKAAIAGWADGAAVALLVAATFPNRVSALVLGTVVARAQGGDGGEPQGFDSAAMDQLAAAIESSWGDGQFLAMLAPSMVGDARFTAWWRRLERSAVTPNAAAAFFRYVMEIDVRALLPAVQVPTLVLHRRDTPLTNLEGARWFAGQIPGARYVELDGVESLPYVGDSDPILDEIEHFLTGAMAEAGEVLVTGTVRELVTGSGLEFSDRGQHLLKGRHGGVAPVQRRALTPPAGGEQKRRQDSA